ncbi:DUF6095 family protein [Flavimarina sp. Hel_I_48]|uniref:DUF6095 family protein n=1 Tax=Flavimarina sp. Hel_I_48 TaxID=1392488 RepID=UPI0004DF9323|nr:DUF6095 family protein [Flavimarina sp. Hel_I_48]
MGTDKEKLLKGLQTLAMCLLFVLLGPGLLYQAFSNKDHPLFLVVLIVGIICFIAAIYFGFKGISKVMKAVFGER